MTERIWDRFLTERDKQVFAASGYGARQGFGKRPALLVIDVSYAFVGEKPEPILEAIKTWRTACGEAGWQSVAVIKQLRELCHAKGVPVIYTTGHKRADNWDAGSWAWKNDRNREDVDPARRNAPAPTVDGNAIVAEIAPGPKDLVVLKQKASGFFGTDLASYLVLLGCDSLIVTGTTTSGCIRATVLDAHALNYRVAVVEDGCFDRAEASHAINLCDMHAKYADVLPSAEVLAFLETYPANQFDLPKGV